MSEQCVDCKEPVYKAADGTLKTDLRKATGSGPSGAERRKQPAPLKPADPTPEKPPRREHLIHRRLFGPAKKAAAK